MINENNNSILAEKHLNSRERENKAAVRDNRDNNKQREPTITDGGRHERLPQGGGERLSNPCKQTAPPSERKKKWGKKISEGMKRFYRKERLRIISGQKPKSSLLSPFPKKMRKAMSDLCYKYGYFHVGKLHTGTLYYDQETRRNMTAEESYARRYGIKFVEGDDTQPGTQPNTHPKPPQGRE